MHLLRKNCTLFHFARTSISYIKSVRAGKHQRFLNKSPITGN